ncbi:MAG TPA: hypothetical protein VGH02_06905 [Rhizomicrobium sp.]
MDNFPDLAAWLQNGSLSQGDRVLISLSRHEEGLTTAEMRKLFASYGRGTASWNFSSITARLADDQKIVLLDRRWTLLEKGAEAVFELGAMKKTATIKAISGLRDFTNKLSDKILRDFVDEAIGCLEHNHYRSAIVLSWSGAVWILQQHVLNKHLKNFNKAGSSRFPDFKQVKNSESFGRIQERDFIQLLEDIHVIGKSLKGILIQRLDLRNTCGHPNTVKVNESTAASHVELLVENVFLRF